MTPCFFLFDLVGPDVVAGAEDRNQLRDLVAAQEIVEETALDHYLVEIVGERFLRVFELLSEDLLAASEEILRDPSERVLRLVEVYLKKPLPHHARFEGGGRDVTADVDGAQTVAGPLPEDALHGEHVGRQVRETLRLRV